MLERIHEVDFFVVLGHGALSRREAVRGGGKARDAQDHGDVLGSCPFLPVLESLVVDPHLGEVLLRFCPPLKTLQILPF